MRDSYNDFCYRQRENCEGRERRHCRLCAHAHLARAPPNRKRQSNQYDGRTSSRLRDAAYEVGVEAHDALRARRDIDMRKTSLDRPDPDGFMPSLFSTD
ncbi:hypothetical protein NUV26_03415 [Burkholderia pseudomultivorans]|uniref:hypothetical protein n=1 Tax=Burkholderia pseudomultivorans TaxID=1207504 RepID=UPI001E3CCCD3|nr:hypothetical protein [Burkholderia pseudomultivorans]MDS0791190.1 hypothetical protein [Burkholderia pseudomultivorans]